MCTMHSEINIVANSWEADCSFAVGNEDHAYHNALGFIKKSIETDAFRCKKHNTSTVRSWDLKCKLQFWFLINNERVMRGKRKGGTDTHTE